MIERGFYRHYKGPVYFVESVGVLHDENFRIVIYQSTESCRDGSTRLRRESDFEAWVDPKTGEPPRHVVIYSDDTAVTLGFVRRFTRIEAAVDNSIVRDREHVDVLARLLLVAKSVDRYRKACELAEQAMKTYRDRSDEFVTADDLWGQANTAQQEREAAYAELMAAALSVSDGADE